MTDSTKFVTLIMPRAQAERIVRLLRYDIAVRPDPLLEAALRTIEEDLTWKTTASETCS